MTLEFKDKAIDDEYSDLKMQEDDLLGELEKVQRRIHEIENTEERE